MTGDHTGGAAALLRLEGITKAYPGVVANNHVDLEVRTGEVHALVGENGAGKSTLLSILYGLRAPDAGAIFMNGRRCHFGSPRDAIHAGIGLVQQHFSVIPTLTLTENATLALRAAGRRVTRREATARITEVGERIGLRVPADVPVGELPIAAQQRAEVLKALAHDVDLLALDEPNALLTPDEWTQLADVLQSLAAEGVAVLLVSHKLSDVLDVAAHVTVLREGQVVASRPTEGLVEADIGELMVGDRRLAAESSLSARGTPEHGRPRLRVDRLDVADDRGVPVVKGVDLEVSAGEVVGLAGVEGSGQIELAEALIGMRTAAGGQIFHDGVDITHMSVRTRRAAGLAYIPADRQHAGVVASMSVAANLLLPEVRQSPFSRGGLLARRELERRADELVRSFDIRTSSTLVPLASLSGGNQQKVVVARELSRRPRTIVACYPTRGLDFAATRFVRERIAEQRDRGAAVLFASLDLDELLAWTDRIVVLQGGRVVGELTSSEADTRRLGLLMGGTKAPS